MSSKVKLRVRYSNFNFQIKCLLFMDPESQISMNKNPLSYILTNSRNKILYILLNGPKNPNMIPQVETLKFNKINKP